MHTVQNEEEGTAEETTDINCNLYYLANSTTKQRLHIGKENHEITIPVTQLL